MRDAAGSGALGDLGAHVIDLARYLVGEVAAVSASARTFRPAARSTTPSRRWSSSRRRGRDGRGDRFAPGRKNALSWEINGSKGSLAFDLERLNELQWSEGTSGFRTMLVSEADHPFWEWWWPHGHVIGWEHTFVHELHHLLDAIATTPRSRRTARPSRTATAPPRSATRSSARRSRAGGSRSPTAEAGASIDEEHVEPARPATASAHAASTDRKWYVRGPRRPRLRRTKWPTSSACRSRTNRSTRSRSAPPTTRRRSTGSSSSSRSRARISSRRSTRTSRNRSPNATEEARSALENPVSGPAFADLLAGKQSVAIVIDNQFRPTPPRSCCLRLRRGRGGRDHRRLRHHREREGFPAVGVRHRDEGRPREPRPDGAARDRAAPERPANPDVYTYLGVTSRGTPVWVHSEVVKRDVKITIGQAQANHWG